MKHVFHLPADSKKYIEYELVGGEIWVWNVYNDDGTNCGWISQMGTSTLAPWELVCLGRAIEIHKQVRDGLREHDPYALWSEAAKKSL